MKLNIKAFALTVGIIFGLATFFITFLSVIMGWEGHALWKLHKIFFGYSPTWYGAIIGLIWGFIYGLIGGTFFAWLYNKLLKQFAVKTD